MHTFKYLGNTVIYYLLLLLISMPFLIIFNVLFIYEPRVIELSSDIRTLASIPMFLWFFIIVPLVSREAARIKVNENHQSYWPSLIQAFRFWWDMVVIFLSFMPIIGKYFQDEKIDGGS